MYWKMHTPVSTDFCHASLKFVCHHCEISFLWATDTRAHASFLRQHLSHQSFSDGDVGAQADGVWSTVNAILSGLETVFTPHSRDSSSSRSRTVLRYTPDTNLF